MIKKKNNELKNLVEQTKNKEKIKKEKANIRWILLVVSLSFIISFCLSYVANSVIPNLNLFLGIIVTLIFIGMGILFDIVGISVTTADEAVFHSMNSRKVKGANIAVKFKKNADKVSSFCCDVIGDICGIISGAAATTISVSLINQFNFPALITGLVSAAIIASLTIGGKALGKSFAVNKSEIILYEFSKFVANFYK